MQYCFVQQQRNVIVGWF